MREKEGNKIWIQWEEDRDGKKSHVSRIWTYEENNKEDEHIKKITGEENACLERMWSIGERKFKDD